MCGIIGLIANQNVQEELYEGLAHLQHRGQDMAGLLTLDEQMHLKVGHGKASDVFNEESLSKLTGHFGIGHLRYPTRGQITLNEAQPLITSFPYGIGLVHNGNIVNYEQLKAHLITKRYYINSTSDSELLLKYFACLLEDYPSPKHSALFFDILCKVTYKFLHQVEGAFSIILTIKDVGILVIRDPYGIRPLSMGQRQGTKSMEYCFVSEDVALLNLGFNQIRDISPGEIVFVDIKGQLYQQIVLQRKFSPCIFEYVYLARPDATIDQVSVYQSRKKMGELLAEAWRKTYPTLMPDVVVPIPFTSNTPALSFAQTLGVRYCEGLYKNVFVGRTFIMPTDKKRIESIKIKLSPQRSELKDKKVLLVDDSMVRGTTSREIVKVVRAAGASEIYLALACSPVKYPCYYGIDIPSKDDLIANQYTNQEDLASALGVDKILYQTIPDLQASLNNTTFKKPCMACIDNNYCVGKNTHEHFDNW